MSNCVFARRRFTSKIVPLADLFNDMTFLQTNGRNNSSTSTASISMNNATSNIPATGVCYLFSFCNGYVGIWKIINRVIQSTPIRQMNAGYGGVVWVNSGSYWCMYYNGGYISGSSSDGSSVYAATLAVVSFPSYTEAEVDATLSKMAMTRLEGRNASSQGNVRATDFSQPIYFGAYGNYFEVWGNDGETISIIKRVGTVERFKTSDSYALATSLQVYGGTIIGCNIP